jgi:hypothetical protein
VIAPLHGAFRGTSALLAPRAQAYLGLVLLGGFAPAFVLGLFGRLGGANASDVFAVGLIGVILATLFTPAIVAVPFSLPTPPHGRPRRDDLLVLPLGPLAIPATTLIGSVAGALGWILAATFGAWLILDASVVSEALQHARSPLAGWVVLGLVSIFCFMFSATTVGNGTMLVAIAWLVPAGLTVSTLGAMGYDASATFAYAVVWAASLDLYLLVLPFALHLLPPYVWSRQQAEERAPAVLAFGLAVAVLLLGVLDAGASLLVVLALTGLRVRHLSRRYPIRRGVSATWCALGLSLPFVLPPVVLGLAVERRADVRDWRAFEGRAVIPSPDGRHVAVRVGPRADGTVRAETSWTVVLDARGERAPIVVPARFTDGAVWSRDGRWLAVEDQAFGRLRLDVPRDERGVPPDVGWFEVAITRAAEAALVTWIVDTTTGEVTRHDRLAVAPGWTEPAQLLRSRLVDGGDVELTDGRGARAVVRRGDGTFRVVAYDDDGAALLAFAQAPPATTLHPVFGAVPRVLTRWTDRTRVDLADGRRWVELRAADGVTVARLGRTLTLPDGAHALVRASQDDEALLIGDAAGLHRLAPDGTRTTLVARERTSLFHAEPARRRAIVFLGDQLAVLDLDTGRLGARAPLTSAPVLGLIGDDLLVGDVGWPAVRAADGALRSLRPAD